LGYII